jgi:hypothetical protein
VKGTKHENFEEALAIRLGQSNVKNGTATDEVIEERIAVIKQWCYIRG